jgi:hypothetical protein
MKDATYFIESEFYRVLNNNISVKVYNLERPVASKDLKYVLIASTYQLPSFSKDNFRGDYYINLDVVTIVPDNAVSTKGLDLIVNQVLQNVCPTPGSNNFSNNADFHIVDCQLNGTTKFKDRTDTQTLLRHVLEFKVIINQK